MRVIVIGNIAHVVVNFPTSRPQNFVSDHRELGVQESFDLVAWKWVVNTPHNHGNETNLTISNPTHLVIDVARGDERRFAEITDTHLTVTVTVECQGTTVPAAGEVETTLVQVLLSELGVMM